jgi:hypothetical protein
VKFDTELVRIISVWGWIRNRYWKKALKNDVENYIKSCLVCQEYQLKRPVYKFDGTSRFTGIFTVWAIDHLEPFLRSEGGNVYVLCVVAEFTGFHFCKAVPDTSSIPVVAFIEETICSFGVPHTIKCDMDLLSSLFTLKNFVPNTISRLVLSLLIHLNGMVMSRN